MSNKILVLGDPGGGKTSSLRNLNPIRTGIINTDRKAPPLQGWRKNYKTVMGADGFPDLSKSNYVEPQTVGGILATIDAWEKRDDIQVIALDTITHMITADYIDNAIGKDFKGYQQMGKNFLTVVDRVRASKKDWAVFGHIARSFNDFGDKITEMRSHGNMIKDMAPPSYFTTVLMAYVERKDGVSKGYFRTQSLGGDPAKSPVYFRGEEVVPALEFIEPNDIAMVFNKLEKFEKADEIPSTVVGDAVKK